MKLKAFCLLDTKAGIFHVPFFMAHVGQAVRACIDLGSDLSTTVGRHPADFALCEVGAFDDQTGVLEAVPPQQLGTVASMLPQRQPAPPLFQQRQDSEFDIPAAPRGSVTVPTLNGHREV